MLKQHASTCLNQTQLKVQKHTGKPEKNQKFPAAETQDSIRRQWF